MTLRRLSSALLVSMTLCTARVAMAEPSARAPSAELDAARRWFDLGLRAVRAGNFAEAQRAFGAAYALVPSVEILWNLASAARKSGDVVSALEHLRRYVGRPDARADRAKLAVEEAIPELESQTAHLALALPEGASVTVDRRPVAPISTVDVLPGVHAVAIYRNGRDRVLAVEAGVGTTTRVMDPDDAPLAPAVVVPAAVPPPPPATPGSQASSQPRGIGRGAATATLGGAALVAVAGGVYFTLAARELQKSSDELRVRIRSDDPTCKRSGTLCDDFVSARNAAARDSALGTSFLVSGGVLAGAAFVAWLLWPASTVHVVPTTAKDGAGVLAVGSF